MRTRRFQIKTSIAEYLVAGSSVLPLICGLDALFRQWTNKHVGATRSLRD